MSGQRGRGQWAQRNRRLAEQLRALSIDDLERLTADIVAQTIRPDRWADAWYRAYTREHPSPRVKDRFGPALAKTIAAVETMRKAGLR